MPPPPLTRQQLLELQDRRRGDVDVRRLLWEVHRLRAIAFRADALRRHLLKSGLVSRADPGAMLALEGLEDLLRNEPVVHEGEKMRADFNAKIDQVDREYQADKRRARPNP